MERPSFDPSSMRDSMKLDFGGGSSQVPTPTSVPPMEHRGSDDYTKILESPSFVTLLNQISNEGKNAQELLNTFKAPQFKPAPIPPPQQLPTPTPTSLLFPERVTSDQLQYAQGFLDALSHVQKSNYKPLLNSPSCSVMLDRILPLVNCLSPQASPVNQPLKPIVSDFEAILSAFKAKKDDNGASTSSPPQQQHQHHLAASDAVTRSSAAAAAAAVLAPPPPPQQQQQQPQRAFFNSSTAAAAAPTMPPPQIVPMQRTASPSEASPLNSSDEDSDSDSSRSKGAGSAPLRSRSTIKRSMNGMEDQESKKLERKRLRNRQAATKCRQKKLARISELEQQVNQEREHAKQLDYNLDLLRKQCRNLEQAIQVHNSNGCTLH